VNRTIERVAATALAAIAVAFIALVALSADSQASQSRTTRHLIGHSVQGRAIYAYQRGDPYGPTVLVVGSIHGNERGGVAVARRLLKMRAPEGIDLWVILNLNPDGRAAGTRGNAHSVDLNRNFPWRWRRLSGAFYSGRRGLSEPESRAAYRLIERLQPWLAAVALDLVPSAARGGERHDALACTGAQVRPPGRAGARESARLPG